MECGAKFFFTSPALLPVFATGGDKTAHPLQVGRSAVSPAKVVELSNEEVPVCGKASTGIELCIEKSLAPVYGKRERLDAKAIEVGQKRRKLSLPKTSVEKNMGKTATRSKDGGENRVGEAEATEIDTKLDEEKR